MNVLRTYFNSFLSKVYSFLITVLPRSPFRQYLRGYDGLHSGLIRAVNYFVPIPTMIVITYTWVVAMALYYLYHALVHKIWNGSDKKKSAYLKNIFNKFFYFFRRLIGKI